MGTGDKIENEAEVLKGKVKEGAGRVTDDPALEAEGKGDQASGHVKQAGEKVKDAVKDIFGK
ncbi:MAG: CsbD family protein [Actinomycetota bacterium]|nr:CsbD family protein [Actinomycetota bacterium]